jgi:hypothetical protein
LVKYTTFLYPPARFSIAAASGGEGRIEGTGVARATRAPNERAASATLLREKEAMVVRARIEENQTEGSSVAVS